MSHNDKASCHWFTDDACETFTPSGFSQTIPFAYGNPEEFCIKEVTVSGIKFLDPNVIINLSGLFVGDTISIREKLPPRPLTNYGDKNYSPM